MNRLGLTRGHWFRGMVTIFGETGKAPLNKARKRNEAVRITGRSCFLELLNIAQAYPLYIMRSLLVLINTMETPVIRVFKH